MTAILLGVLLLVSGSTASAGQRFYPDDPITVDEDNLAIPRPEPHSFNSTLDELSQVLLPDFLFGGLPDPVPRAENVNTLGEVPDSSWFTNRIGGRAMSAAEIGAGPGARAGPPATDRPLVVTGFWSSQTAPGLLVRDHRGNDYLLKFDSHAHPRLATGADIIVRRLLHAAGYNVVGGFIVQFSEQQLELGAGATFRGGREGERLTDEHMSWVRAILPHGADGRIRAVASPVHAIDPLDPFRFDGTRPDDANDLFPHENRRELRGYRLFAAWLNIDQSGPRNTLDIFVGDGGTGHVRHLLIDFMASLGSGHDQRLAFAPKEHRMGYEYPVDPGSAMKSFLTLGLWEPQWMKVDNRRSADRTAIGRIEADVFRPEKWKPAYPNPAFDSMLDDDAFWAARLISQFTDNAIRAAVDAAQYAPDDGADELTRILIARRDKISAYYFRQLNPLDDFAVEDGHLRFRNVGEEAGLAPVTGYEVAWFAFDNQTGTRTPLGPAAETKSRRIALPESTSEYLLARIRTRSSEPRWRLAVDVFVRLGDTPRVVGIERELNDYP